MPPPCVVNMPPPCIAKTRQFLRPLKAVAVQSLSAIQGLIDELSPRLQMFFGDTCQLSVYCRHHQCAGGATCVPDMERGSYSCDCPVGKMGRLCDSGEWISRGIHGALLLKLPLLVLLLSHMFIFSIGVRNN